MCSAKNYSTNLDVYCSPCNSGIRAYTLHEQEPSEPTHVVQVASKIELFAVLGKIYPDNVVVKDKGIPLSVALSVGKEGLPDAGRFVIEVGK